MKKITAKNIFFLIICAAVAFLIAFSVICPNINFSEFHSQGEPINQIKPSDAPKITACEVSADGKFTLPPKTDYAVLEFQAKGEAAKTIEIQLSEIEKSGTKLTIERTADGSFTDMLHTEETVTAEKSVYCIGLKDECSAVRIWFRTNCRIDNVSLYDTDPVVQTQKLEHSPLRYAAVAIITLLVLIAAFLIDIKCDLSGKFIKKAKDSYKNAAEKINKKTILLSIGKAVLWFIIPAAIATQLIYQFVLGRYIDRSSISVIVFFAIFALIAVLVTQRKNIATAPEKAVGLIIVILGLTIVLTQPFAHVCWDNDSHYPWAIQNSFVGKAYYSEADTRIDIPSQDFIYEAPHDSAELIKEYNEIGDTYIKIGSITFSAPHLPSGITIATSRMLGANFHTRYMLGQAANVIGYAILCFFAIKKLKSGKIIMSIVALFPTNLFIAANYSYDWWVTGFALLGTAYFISEMQQPEKPISTRDTIIMCAAFMLMALPKQLYVILFALPLFLYKKGRTKKETVNYYLIVAIFFVITLLMFAARSASSLGGSGDIRGGAVNPGQQLLGILADPFGYAKILIKFLFKYLSIDRMAMYVSLFAYMDLSSWGHIIVALICFAVLTDKDKYDKFKGSIIIRILAVLVLIGGVALAATSMYLAFTPVGYDTINGCQERYIMPLLSPVLLTISNPGIGFKNKALYNTVMISATTLVAFACIGEAIIKVVL